MTENKEQNANICKTIISPVWRATTTFDTWNLALDASVSCR